MKDQIDAAIHSQRTTTKMLNIGITIASTGRPAAVQVPADMSVHELIELLSFLPVGIANELTKQNASKIVPVTTMPPLGKLK
jgi:hypothetical protein